MASLTYNIEIDENRDNTLVFIWYDSEGNKVDLTGMGAVAEIVDKDETSVSKVEDGSGITLHTAAGDEGKITIVFPKADLSSLTSSSYKWELVVFPTSGSPTVNPESLLKGLALAKSETASLT